MISGVVTDAEGALAGASVKVKGTNKAVVADVNGRFSLDADAQDVLELLLLLGLMELLLLTRIMD